MSTAAIVEIGGSHAECLYSQVLFLARAGIAVTLHCSVSLKDTVSHFKEVEQVYYYNFSKPHTRLSEWKALHQVWRRIQAEKPTYLLFNTAQGNRIRKLLLFPFSRKMQISGIIHQVNKLSGSGSQWFISQKVQHYFVLNDYLLAAIPAAFRKKASSFYPIFFPKNALPVHLQKPPGEIWIVVPGLVEQKRRDYHLLLRQAGALLAMPQLRIFLCGNGWHAEGDGAALQLAYQEAGLGSLVVMFQDFVSNALMHSILAAADIIAPLLHPDTGSGSGYVSQQISGSFNLAFSHRKPLLMHEAFHHIPDFQENALFYTENTFAEILHNLPRLLAEISCRVYQDEKWDFAYQQKNFLLQLKK